VAPRFYGIRGFRKVWVEQSVTPCKVLVLDGDYGDGS
jgi:hypothetical protein